MLELINGKRISYISSGIRSIAFLFLHPRFSISAFKGSTFADGSFC